MHKLSITLTESQKAFIDSEVSSGRFASTSEVLRDALRERQDQAEFQAWLLNRHDQALKEEAEGKLLSHEEVFGELRRQVGLPE